MAERTTILETFAGKLIVLDLTSPYVILGTFYGMDGPYYVVDQADIHDLRDTTSTRDVYVLDAKRHGVNSNRKRILVREDGVVGIALLADVIE
jgi:hypothetical protein